MIATGGLLRINARRQGSLKSKPHKPHTHKRKNRKRQSEVVVVKGKLKLCSVSGLVAVLGILVLLVGSIMAALGYWPQDGLLFGTQVQEGNAMASVSSVGSTAAPVDTQDGDDLEEHGDDGGDGFNQTETGNRTISQPPLSFLQDFLDRYLYSDRLKVFGPLIMGIGIFLFICANAVLHEDRDRNTKVINLRDIYSTVIDIHSSSTRRSSTNPLNGLINYVQSKSLETKPRTYPSSLSRSEGGGGRGLSLRQLSAGDGGGDAVFSIYQPEVPVPSSPPHRLSLPPSFSPPPHLPHLQKEALCSTLPLLRPRIQGPRRSHSTRARTGLWTGATGGKEAACPHQPPLCASSLPLARPFQEVLSCSSQLSHLSHLSLSSLSHLLSSSSTTPAPPCRRRSLPTTSFHTGYSKLTQGGDQSFDSAEVTSSLRVGLSEEVNSQRKY
ncbi:transmembrane protein 200C [Mastacembelus armatus]|uniref:transmembrane protein 200C n=1 Tax=Mastacembelus armatus TaxID=205130 RepID=UPI000E45FEDF|nr:transmembrane protein 200C-like [Mastacembelus armatus]